MRRLVAIGILDDNGNRESAINSWRSGDLVGAVEGQTFRQAGDGIVIWTGAIAGRERLGWIDDIDYGATI